MRIICLMSQHLNKKREESEPLSPQSFFIFSRHASCFKSHASTSVHTNGGGGGGRNLIAKSSWQKNYQRHNNHCEDTEIDFFSVFAITFSSLTSSSGVSAL